MRYKIFLPCLLSLRQFSVIFFSIFSVKKTFFLDQWSPTSRLWTSTGSWINCQRAVKELINYTWLVPEMFDFEFLDYTFDDCKVWSVEQNDKVSEPSFC